MFHRNMKSPSRGLCIQSSLLMLRRSTHDFSCKCSSRCGIFQRRGTIHLQRHFFGQKIRGCKEIKVRQVHSATQGSATFGRFIYAVALCRKYILFTASVLVPSVGRKNFTQSSSEETVLPLALQKTLLMWSITVCSTCRNKSHWFAVRTIVVIHAGGAVMHRDGVTLCSHQCFCAIDLA